MERNDDQAAHPPDFPPDSQNRRFKMRVTIVTISVALCLSSVVGLGIAQQPSGPRVARMPNKETTHDDAKFKFILFWKENNRNTQQLTEVLKLAVAGRSERANWIAVNVDDVANRELVERYQVSRVPMPTVLCVAPNGAITGVFMRQLNDQGVERALVTPAMADVTKAIQDKKIVVLHIKPAADSPLPTGGADFVADPDFEAKTIIVDLLLHDPAEARFLKDMKLKAADVSESVLVVMAPPGVLVGKFAAHATKQQIVAQLHAAGKCCDDPNCKHNQ
jgi:hypothetical protein